jgi:predicted kinase
MRLGGAVFDLMAQFVRDLLTRRVSVIAEGNFGPRWSLLADLPECRMVQLHITATPEVLRERLTARDRHGVHYDRDAADEIAERAGRGDWSPLPLAGELIEIDTSESFPDARSIASRSVFRER